MKKIILIIGVLLCTTSIIAVISSAQVPRAAFSLVDTGPSWNNTWGVLGVMFPLGSLTITPQIEVNDYVLSHGVQHLYFGISVSGRTQLLQLKMAYVFAAAGVSAPLFYHALDLAQADMNTGVGWSANPFLDIHVGGSLTTMLKRSLMFPFYLWVSVQISWPLF